MDEAFNRNKKGKEKEFVKEVEGVGKRNKRGYIYINIYIYIYIYRERERERQIQIRELQQSHLNYTKTMDAFSI